jgi:hypothetical protein
MAPGLDAPALAAPLATVTVLEGKTHVARATLLYAPAEGATLEQGDIVELEEGSLMQLELADGSALSFGGKARVFMPAPAGQADRRTDVLLAAGWSKLDLVSAAQLPAVRTPLVRLISQKVSYVMHAGEDGTRLFVEGGELVPVFTGSRPGQPAVIKAGEFVAVKPDASATLAGRPPPDFVAAMPRPYLDKLPQRLARLKARGVELKRERGVSFAEVDGWIKDDPAGRAGWIAQFQPLLKDPGFVHDLEPALRDYPEWGRVLHPEKRRAKAKPQAQ